MSFSGSYVGATRHPWPCLLFVLPLLTAYEVCVLQLGGDHPEVVRNGADNWVRVALAASGVGYPWLPPAVLALLFAARSHIHWHDRPDDLIGVLSGMALESVAYALGLWAMSRALPQLLVRWGITLATEAHAGVGPGTVRLVSYLGAGIYEEALFRLLLYSGLLKLLRYAGLPLLPSAIAAATASATAFSAAHHIGPYGQPYTNYVFLFRLAAGLYFAALYQLRGFGITVGAHACYNVMVGVGTG
jgi:membrane protease YdiL (CAAX protease family)